MYKPRLKMPTKHYTHLLAFLLTCLAVNGFAQTDTILDKAEEMPLFEGCGNHSKLKYEEKLECSYQKLADFVAQNINYPDSAVIRRSEGTILIEFVVNELGDVTQVVAKNDLPDGLAQEAVRMVQLMPQWHPAQQNGKPVAVRLRLPVKFDLADYEQRYQKKRYRVFWGKAVGSNITTEEIKTLANESVIVRDLMGTEYKLEVLEVTLERKQVFTSVKKEITNFDKAMKRLLAKAKPGDALFIVATVQDGTGRVEVERVFDVK
jgi:TonB family protein